MAPSAQATAFSAASSASNALTAAGKTAGGDLVQVNHRRHHWDGHRRWHHHRHWRHHRHWNVRPRSGFYLEFGTGGFHTRPYYVRPPRRAYGLPAAHVNWCYARYRSYRAADNTFQPYYGPRRVCVSPYWR